MNFSEAVRKARPSDFIVGNPRRMFKIDGEVLKAVDADDYKMNGIIPEKFEIATPDLSELTDLSWAVIPSNSKRVSILNARYAEALCAYNNNADYIDLLEFKLGEKRDNDSKRLLINALSDAKTIVQNLESIDKLLTEE